MLLVLSFVSSRYCDKISIASKHRHVFGEFVAMRSGDMAPAHGKPQTASWEQTMAIPLYTAT
jgi:hypothetical protein